MISTNQHEVSEVCQRFEETWESTDEVYVATQEGNSFIRCQRKHVVNDLPRAQEEHAYKDENKIQW